MVMVEAFTVSYNILSNYSIFSILGFSVSVSVVEFYFSSYISDLSLVVFQLELLYLTGSSIGPSLACKFLICNLAGFVVLNFNCLTNSDSVSIFYCLVQLAGFIRCCGILLRNLILLLLCGSIVSLELVKLFESLLLSVLFSLLFLFFFPHLLLHSFKLLHLFRLVPLSWQVAFLNYNL
jgi:hypothetical protein